MKKSLFTAALLFISTSGAVIAGGEPVNCRVENVGVQNIYAGIAGCSDRGQYISRIFEPTPFEYRTHSEIINGSIYSCTAKVPFSYQDDLVDEVCDYYPTAMLTIDNFSSAEVYVAARGHDKDGTYSVTLYIDGKKQSGTSKLLHGSAGDKWLIKSVVTDNDGYKSTKSAYATIEDTGSLNPF